MSRPTQNPRSSRGNHRLLALAFTGLSLAGLFPVMRPVAAHAQDAAPPAAAATLDTTMQAAEADAQPRRKLVKWNEYDGPITTLRFGVNFMVDGVTYSQDDKSKQQFDLEPDTGLRDFRFVLNGRFKTKRPLSWSLGYMYDGADKQWRFRQTGLMIGVPELSGQFFIGRSKEGYSLVKVGSGVSLWGIERSQTLDAFVPILADGVKYMGYYPGPRINLTLGVYGDALAESEKFATYDNQLVARLTWLPILSEEEGRLLSVAVMGRDCEPDDGFLREKAKPGAYLAPSFLDTGKFAADRSRTFGIEAFYRAGPWLVGTEYDWQRDDAASGETPVFHGGEATIVWNITGETRPYNLAGAYFGQAPTRKSLFEGGTGRWEAVLNVTYNDFDDGSFQGGKFWRVTPMMNWHLAEFLRLELVYGYGVLDRFGVKGETQFFQSRLQVSY